MCPLKQDELSLGIVYTPINVSEAGRAYRVSVVNFSHTYVILAYTIAAMTTRIPK
jgi:hypothetical protein